ncbi:uncharacterized protein LOC105663346 [Megachile rotundata]|uniref:uncharacterized protein LOC105663346 n=1 Tax=Megachile rotundata TaxID=143995 RepID=UPI0006153585|nr:PREDICTED: uncharacterized protein LOC105663346 [Megachile rotundata]
MELVETCAKIKQPLYRKPLACPCNVKCTSRYVQPARAKSFAPVPTYKPPSKLLETHTTYHLSYLNLDNEEFRRSKCRPIRPTPALSKFEGKISGDTTNNLSYKHIGHVPKVKPILPRHRSMIGSGPMDNVTTVRHDYAQKHVEKSKAIVPCGNIRLSTGKLEANTTAKLSYVDPGPTEPTVNFKPMRIYCPPSEPIPHDTTQKLSYQPVCIEEKETHPWQQKPIYNPPEVAMCGRTTYSESYLKNEESCTEKPIRPTDTISLLPHEGQFERKTIYKESYLELDGIERVAPIIPCPSISKADGKISGDTTTKLSYQAVQSEKRAPILPRQKKMTGDGPMQSETTTRCDFHAKAAQRPDPVIPCNNLRSADTPIEDKTTAKLSYMKPEAIEMTKSFKPVVRYVRLQDKIDSETVSKLSYQPWTPLRKEEMPWATKGRYQPPTAPMCSDTIYHVSYPAPGYYEDVCIPEECDCLETKDVCPLAEQVNASPKAEIDCRT